MYRQFRLRACLVHGDCGLGGVIRGGKRTQQTVANAHKNDTPVVFDDLRQLCLVASDQRMCRLIAESFVEADTIADVSNQDGDVSGNDCHREGPETG